MPSSVCGCAGFLRDITAEPIDDLRLPIDDCKSKISTGRLSAENQKSKISRNVIIADYTDLETGEYADVEDLLQIDRSVRSRIEDSVSEKVARKIVLRLAKSDSEIESMIQAGYSLAKNMSWDVAVKNYLLPSLQKVMHKQFIEGISTKS